MDGMDTKSVKSGKGGKGGKSAKSGHNGRDGRGMDFHRPTRTSTDIYGRTPTFTGRDILKVLSFER